jgi:hypothetical protein
MARWDRGGGGDFAITTVNVPDRLDAQEVRARASARCRARLPCAACIGSTSCAGSAGCSPWRWRERCLGHRARRGSAARRHLPARGRGADRPGARACRCRCGQPSCSSFRRRGWSSSTSSRRRALRLPESRCISTGAMRCGACRHRPGCLARRASRGRTDGPAGAVAAAVGAAGGTLSAGRDSTVRFESVTFRPRAAAGALRGGRPARAGQGEIRRRSA